MHGRWRLFRHEAGRASGPAPWAYVALFAACIMIGLWSADTFGAIVIWPANGVMLAALLQLHRKQAVAVLLSCLLPACTSSTSQDNEPLAEGSVDAAPAPKQKTVLDDQLKALDKAKTVEATLEDGKAAQDKAIDEASGG